MLYLQTHRQRLIPVTCSLDLENLQNIKFKQVKTSDLASNTKLKLSGSLLIAEPPHLSFAIG